MEKSQKKFILIGVAVIMGLSAVLGGLLFIRQKQDAVERQRIVEIKLEREEASITLTRDGTLTVEIPEGIFQQQWDESEVNAFFAQFENQDLGRYAEPEAGFEGYFLTVKTGDNRQVIYFIPFLGIEIPQVVERLIGTLEEIVKGSLRPTPKPTGYTLTTTPTSTPFLYYPTAVPTQNPGGLRLSPTPVPTGEVSGGTGGNEAYKIPFECGFSDPNIRQNVLSETVCTPK